MIRFGLGFMLALAMLGLSAGCKWQTLQQNGVQAVLQAAPDSHHPWPRSSAAQRELMENAREVIFSRARSVKGISDVDVRVQGHDRLILQFASASADTSDILHRLTSTAQLEIYWLKDVHGGYNPSARWRAQIPAAPGGAYVFTGRKGETIDSAKQPQAVLEKVVNVSRNKPILTGKDLLPNATADIGRNGGAMVKVEFNSEASEVFREFTASHVRDMAGIFFGGKLLSAPVIAQPIRDGKVEFSGFRNLAEARMTADYLNAGDLPVPLKVVSKESQ